MSNQPGGPRFPQSVTQQRLSQHEAEFSHVADELARTKRATATANSALMEGLGEVRLEVDALDTAVRESKEVGDTNTDSIASLSEQVEVLTKANKTLGSILNDELERVRNEHGSKIESIANATTDIQRSGASTNGRINDVYTEMSALRSRCEDDLERMKGQMRQNRIEIDDSRRQIGIISDLQGAMVELNGNQKELASAVGGLQQSSIYISEWVQTLRSEATELRALVTNCQQEQTRSTQALASDVAVLSEDIAGLRTKIGNQDAEMLELRETLAGKIDNVAVNVTRSVEAERREVQQVLDSVKEAMKRQNQQNQHVMQTLHSGQQRLASQVSDNMQVQGDKHRFLEQAVGKLESAFNLKTSEMARGLDDHVKTIKRHLDANDQAVRMVTDMMTSSLAGRTINHNFSTGMAGDNISPERGKAGNFDFTT